MLFHASVTALGSVAAHVLILAFAILVAAVVAGYVFGPLSKNRGPRRSFYGEDQRHAAKGADAYNGVRLVLKAPVDAAAVRGRLLGLLAAEGNKSLLRVHMLSTTEYEFFRTADDEVAALLMQESESNND